MLGTRSKSAETPPRVLELRYSSQTIASTPKLAPAGEYSVYKVVRTSRLYEQIVQQEGSPHLAELRLILEPGIAALAATRVDQENLTAMREAVAVMERSQKN